MQHQETLSSCSRSVMYGAFDIGERSRATLYLTRSTQSVAVVEAHDGMDRVYGLATIECGLPLSFRGTVTDSFALPQPIKLTQS